MNDYRPYRGEALKDRIAALERDLARTRDRLADPAAMVPVNPAFTSVIGRLKYARAGAPRTVLKERAPACVEPMAGRAPKASAAGRTSARHGRGVGDRNETDRGAPGADLRGD